jgi:hypothetical protein
VTESKQSEQDATDESGIGAASSDAPQMGLSMTYWLESINLAVIAKLWTRAGEIAKAVPNLTTWESLESGTTSKGGYQVAAIASITPDGFALTFTVKDTSASAGKAKR